MQRGDAAAVFHGHPMNSERSASAYAVADKVKGYYQPGVTNPRHAELLESNALFHKRAEMDSGAGSGGGLLAVMQTALSTYDQRQKVKFEEKRQKNRIAFVNSVNRVSTIVRSGPVGKNTWRVRVKYNGNQPLTGIVLKLRVPQNRYQKRLEIVKHANGVLRPGVTFNVDFSHEELAAFGVRSRDIQFSYDSASPLSR